MKLLYIGDNSDSLNLGCRSTSIAMRQLAGRHGQIIGTVPTEMIARRWPLSDRIGDAAYGALSHVFNRNKVRGIPLAGALIGKVMDGLGTRDAITHDLAANAAALNRARAYSADARRLFDWIEECDAVLVNGEGDLIFGTPARGRLLFILTLCNIALERGKKLFYLNAMASAAPEQQVNQDTARLADSVLSRAAAFSLRDPVSQAFAAEHLPAASPRAAMYPDALFTWHHHAAGAAERPYEAATLAPYFERASFKMPAALEQPYILVGGSSRSTNDRGRAIETYTALVNSLAKLGMPVALLPGCTGDFFLRQVAENTGATYLPIKAPILMQTAILAHARLYISGRWHPSIMAGLGGTPCVFMGSNSHKILALQHMLGYPNPHEFSPWPDAAQREEMIAQAQNLLSQGTDLRRDIAARAAELGAKAMHVVDPLDEAQVKGA